MERPDMFTICNNPEATVKERWTEHGWDLSFRRLLNDWEVDRVANLPHEIGDFTGTTSVPDYEMEAQKGWDFLC